MELCYWEQLLQFLRQVNMSKTKWQESEKMKESDMVQKLISLRTNIEEVIAALKHQREIIIKEHTDGKVGK